VNVTGDRLTVPSDGNGEDGDTVIVGPEYDFLHLLGTTGIDHGGRNKLLLIKDVHRIVGVGVYFMSEPQAATGEALGNADVPYTWRSFLSFKPGKTYVL
jgi:hypothetical protein